MALTESIAFSLLIDHTSILHGRISLFSYALGDRNLEDLCEFPPLAVNFSILKAPNAPRLRLALDLLNALCACDGFDPVENQHFWRRVLIELLLKPPKNAAVTPLLDHELPPFDALAFSRFEFGMFPTWADPNANEFWRDMISCGVLSPEAADVHRERDVLAQRLSPYVVKPVRLLALSLMLSPLSERVPPQRFWETVTSDTVVRCTSDIQQQRQAAATMGFALPLFSPFSAVYLHITPRQVIGAFIRPNDAPYELEKTARILRAGPLVVVSTIMFGGMPWCQSTQPRERMDTLTALGRLLRVDYFGDKTIRSFTMLANSFTYQCLGALLSVAPHLSLFENATVSWYPRQEKLLGVAWLAYALYHPKRRPQKQSGHRLLKHLTLHLSELNNSEIQYVNTVIRSGMPLRDVAGVVLHNRYGPRANIQVDCLSLGVTAVLPQGTPVYYEPGRHAAPYELAILDRTEELDVVAHLPVEGFLGVVYPGFGLVWVDHTVAEWTASGYPTTKKRKQVPNVGALLVTSSLRLELRKAERPSTRSARVGPPQSPLPLFLGQHLRALTLLKYSPLARDDLELILTLCPLLWRLEIRQCLIDSLWPLLDAYLAGQCRVSSLGVASDGNDVDNHQSEREKHAAPADIFGPIVETLCDATHPLTLRLRELNVDLRDTAFEDTNVRHLMRALRTGTTKLERLVVKTYATSSAHVARELGRYRDQLLYDSSQTRLTFLSVLRSRGLWMNVVGLHQQRRLNQHIVRTIFEFTGGSVVRRVRWLFRPRSR